MEIGEVENKERIDLKSQNGTTSIINKIMNQKTIPVFNKYSAYKDSGVEWLGEIPEHWEVTRLGSRFEERKTKVSDKDFAPLSVTKQGILPQLDSAAKSNDGDNRKLVIKGDFVINSRSDRKGSSGIANKDGSVSLINTVMKTISFNSSFCNYLLRSNAFVEENYRIGRGIVADLWTTRYDEMKNIKIGIPSPREQKAIATFLDNKTAKIDHAIAQKEKMIALLKERKQIIIQDLVTGKKVWNETLNTWSEPTELKDSGVEWIGEIPAHWEVKRLKYVFKVYKEKVSGLDSDLPFVGMENIESKSGKYIHTISEVEGLSNRFKKGDILFGKLRPYLAKVYLAEFNGICSTEFIVFENANSRYFSKLLLSDTFIQVVDGSTYGAKMPRASLEFIRNIEIPIPAVKEQNAIVSHIESQSTKIDKAITLQEQQIEKLKELKSTLIDSAVTGKIKV